MDSIVGSWKYDVPRCPGIQEYWEMNGIPKAQQTDEFLSKFTLSIVKNGNDYDYIMEAPGFPKKVNKFTPGQPFDFESVSGLVQKTTVTVDGGKVIETMVQDKTGMEITSIREVNNDEMKMTCSGGGRSETIYLIRA